MLDEKSGGLSMLFIKRGTRMSESKIYMAIHPIVVESLHSHPKCQPHGGIREKVRAPPNSLRNIVWEP